MNDLVQLQARTGRALVDARRLDFLVRKPDFESWWKELPESKRKGLLETLTTVEREFDSRIKTEKTYKELRALAKQYRIPYYADLTKAQLEREIESVRETIRSARSRSASARSSQGDAGRNVESGHQTQHAGSGV